jgi:hypothetical protein
MRGSLALVRKTKSMRKRNKGKEGRKNRCGKNNMISKCGRRRKIIRKCQKEYREKERTKDTR